MEKREQLTIGPCCYKTKIGHLLRQNEGTHPIWSMGDLKLELLLPFLCDCAPSHSWIHIDILLPVITRSTQQCIKSLLEDERVKSISILTRDSNSLPLDEWKHTEKLRIGQHKYLSTQVVTIAANHETLQDKRFVLSGSIPQEVSQADQLMMLSNDVWEYEHAHEYIDYLKQTFIR